MKTLILSLTLLSSMSSYGNVTASETSETRKILCVDRRDSYFTKVLMTIDKDENLLELSVVTPEYLWTTPGQPETMQAPEGFSLETPNLIELSNYNVIVMKNSEGLIRLIDFRPVEPDDIEVEGFSGSIAFHDILGLTGGTPGSLYYTSSGNPSAPVYPLNCKGY